MEQLLQPNERLGNGQIEANMERMSVGKVIQDVCDIFADAADNVWRAHNGLQCYFMTHNPMKPNDAWDNLIAGIELKFCDFSLGSNPSSVTAAISDGFLLAEIYRMNELRDDVIELLSQYIEKGGELRP